MYKKLINCDLGECLTPDNDATIMPLIDMANIACGGHASDDYNIAKTIKLALKNLVIIGAHPSYNDKVNFGRISYELSADELFATVYKQVSNFQKICLNLGAKLTYIKPHGALYHDMMKKDLVMDTICRVVKNIGCDLALVVQTGINSKKIARIAKKLNITFYYETFADRAYNKTQLIPRISSAAVLNNVQDIIKQYRQFLYNKAVEVDTIYFHSDNQASIKALQLLKNV